MQSEKRQIRKGVAWNAVGMMVGKGSSILAKVGLARLLLPEHFGFFNMVLVFSAIIAIIADLGFRLGLIQRQRDHRTKLLYDSAFWLLFLSSFVMIAVMWLIGVPFLVWFYGEPRLAPIALAMSTAIVFQNLQVVPEARLARSMRFKQIALADIAGTLAGCVAAVALALAGANVWSLVAQTLVAAACTCAVTFALSGWFPRIRMNLAILRDLSSYSRFIVGSRVLISFQQNLDYLLIGKLVGAHALGIYSIAFLLTETLRGKAYWLVSKAVFPFYSRAIGRDADIRAVYLGTVRYMSVTIFPAATVLILFANYIVPTLFTPKWNAAIVPIQILAAASMVVASAGTPGEVLRGIGRPDLDFRINLAVSTLVALPALWIGISWLGLPGAALAVLGHYCVSRIAYGVALWRLIRLPMLDLFRALQRPLLGSGLMAAIALLVGSWHSLLVLVLALAAYATVVCPLVLPRLRPHYS
ncbi:lipopolysaccharide biosynthesis protein [Sphingobium sp. TKS]|uniref:lipopolysaccharide biosynthesis protein n=1 Tax=Sphingobium sp. TKS TaxID=1315974 RepID=UPI00077034EF|nr:MULTISPECIES: lipopolysaccharide biosynthesis protein [Sphingomonadaceae]AMK25202.1 polysaccharide biosynthesis protein [Sphingobium sp. TKS]